ncbi:Ankyrin repeat-containing domain [Pseudocohnilembus persalinus]|uniref:Ankyrin repeat-containing domain n=1 Tax=Pseudocohnilembus persalinus TaxID=266149 RepID=A0A0V0QLE3_PSEPJ|nr:Ankyrin repeat-containing domain [Pseudocohnilembus persalinus]|eukprot:KRX02940.1 Ankyrin repeat-containing domain [Pseudocohnilembus persalinus]
MGNQESSPKQTAPKIPNPLITKSNKENQIHSIHNSLKNKQKNRGNIINYQQNNNHNNNNNNNNKNNYNNKNNNKNNNNNYNNNGLGCYGCMQNNNQEPWLDLNELNLDHETNKPKGRLTNKSVQYLSSTELSFFQSCASRNLSKIRFYLKQGININILDEERTSPLHIAARHGSYQIVQELLNSGANTDITDIGGWTPLHIAVFFQRNQIVNLLLMHRCNKYIKNRDGQTPFDLIRDQKTMDVFLMHDIDEKQDYKQLQIQQMNQQKMEIIGEQIYMENFQKSQENSHYNLDNPNNNNLNIHNSMSKYSSKNNVVQSESQVLQPKMMATKKHQYYLYFKSLKQKISQNSDKISVNSLHQFQSSNFNHNEISPFKNLNAQFNSAANPLWENNKNYNSLNNQKQSIQNINKNNLMQNKKESSYGIKKIEDYQKEDEFEENAMEDIGIEQERNECNRPSQKKFMQDYYQTLSGKKQPTLKQLNQIQNPIQAQYINSNNSIPEMSENNQQSPILNQQQNYQRNKANQLHLLYSAGGNFQERSYSPCPSIGSLYLQGNSLSLNQLVFEANCSNFEAFGSLKREQQFQGYSNIRVYKKVKI